MKKLLVISVLMLAFAVVACTKKEAPVATESVTVDNATASTPADNATASMPVDNATDNTTPATK